MHANYGDLYELDLEEVDKAFNQPFDVTEPFSSFVKRLENCTDIVELGEASYTLQQIVNKVVNLIVISEAFPEELDKWRRESVADKTWAAFKLSFTKKI